MGCRRLGSPTRIDYFDQGQDKVMENPAAVREGSGRPHVAVNNRLHTPVAEGGSPFWVKSQLFFRPIT